MIQPDGEIEISVNVTNTGDVEGEETAQLYIHQRYGSDSRPVRLLKGIKKVVLIPGETKRICFKLRRDELSYWSASQNKYLVDETEFDVWVGGDSKASLHGHFCVK